MGLVEPRVHSYVTDCLPEDHPWAWETVHCARCGVMVHGLPNENMTTWVETDGGPFCMACAAEIDAGDDGLGGLTVPDP